MLRSTSSRRDARRSLRHVRPCLEQLESRFVPYALNGGTWLHPELMTISFVPDGTPVGIYNSQGQQVHSTLFADMNARFVSPAIWQREILEGANAWARQTNLNFSIVPDNGAVLGYLGSLQQGDPNFGDI